MQSKTFSNPKFNHFPPPPPAATASPEEATASPAATTAIVALTSPASTSFIAATAYNFYAVRKYDNGNRTLGVLVNILRSSLVLNANIPQSSLVLNANIL